MFRKVIHLLTASIIGLGMLAIFSLQPPISADYGLQQTTTPEHAEELENARIITELISDESCQLPCFWGFEVGEDDIDLSKAKIEENLNNVDFRETTVYAEPPFNVLGVTLRTNSKFSDWDLEGDVNLFLIFDPQTDFLSQVNLHIYQSSDSYVNWQPYSPATILEKYGYPDRIGFRLNDDKWTCYWLILHYDSIGLKIEYTVPIMLDSTAHTRETELICNTFQIDEITIELYHETRFAPEISDIGVDWLDEVSDLTIEEFTSMFSQLNWCITVHRNKNN